MEHLQGMMLLQIWAKCLMILVCSINGIKRLQIKRRQRNLINGLKRYKKSIGKQEQFPNDMPNNSHFIIKFRCKLKAVFTFINNRYISITVAKRTMKSRNKFLQQHSDLSPLTHATSNSNKPSYKHHLYSIKDANIQLTFTSHPSQKMHIKVIQEHLQQVFEISLTKRILDEMDPGVLATFQTIQSMYNQFALILKDQPSDFQILETGIIKVKITVTMKSGARKRELVLETQRRQITETQKLRLEYEKKFQRSKKTMQQLAQKLAKTENQLMQCRKQNKELKTIIKELNKQLKEQVHSIQLKLKQQRTIAQQLIEQLKQNIEMVRSNMGRIEFSVRGILDGGTKIILVPDKKSKCFKPGHKDNSFNISNVTPDDHNALKITKTGKQKWVQVVFQKNMTEPMSYFDIEITKSKNNYICVGVCSKMCVDEQDSKWSKFSITIFLLDRSIISEGKSVPNSVSPNLQRNKQHIKSIKIRVVINCINKSVEWYENQIKIGLVQFSEDFYKLCQTGEISPLIICADEDDQIILR